MTVHLFGEIWSPVCEAYALQKTFEDYEKNYDEKVKTARRNS